MPLPVLAIGAGKLVGGALLSKLFGGGRGRGGGGYQRQPFEFDFDENDPELAYMRKQILQSGGRTRRNTVDEIGRAGLLGTGASFDLLRQGETDVNSSLEDVAGSIYGRRRGEAHGDYVGDVNYGRGLEDRGYQARQDALGGIGKLGGGMLQDWWRRRLLQGGDDSTDEDWEEAQAERMGIY